MTLYPYLVVDLPITDTNTYRTNPFNSLISTSGFVRAHKNLFYEGF